MQKAPVIPLVLTSAAALVGFIAVAGRVSTRRSFAQDDAFRNEVQEARVPTGDEIAEAAGPLGKEWLHLPLAACLSAALWFRGIHWMRAIVPTVASAGAEIASRVLDAVPPHRSPPPGHPKQHKPSFPSGHALETSAVSLTCAYVLAREDLIPPGPAFGTAALLTVASSAGRLYLDRHWISDSIGGALVGVAIASGCAALYERARSHEAPLFPSGLWFEST